MDVHAVLGLSVMMSLVTFGVVTTLYLVPHHASCVDARAIGAAFFIPTAVVPPLLVVHGLIFWVPLRSR